MNRINTVIFVFCFFMSFTSCYTSKVNVVAVTDHSEQYSQEDSIPNILVIMPPINKTHHVRAKEYFYATLAKPLVEKGFYVMPPLLTLDFLKHESGYDSERFLKSKLSKFKKYLGADVALFTIIHRWEKLAMVGSVFVQVEYIFKDTSTDKILFRRIIETEADGTIDLTTDSNSNDNNQTSLAAEAILALVSISLTSLNSAQIKHHKIAQKCNDELMKYLPEGNYRRTVSSDIGNKIISEDLVVD